jgi:hypothetical protein
MMIVLGEEMEPGKTTFAYHGKQQMILATTVVEAMTGGFTHEIL